MLAAIVGLGHVAICELLISHRANIDAVTNVSIEDTYCIMVFIVIEIGTMMSVVMIMSML